MAASLLLDTCALIWLANGDHISERAETAIRDAEADGTIFISPISAWEVGTLVAKGRLRLTEPSEAWFEKLCRASALGIAELTIKILVRSTELPGNPPSDPADRMIISTARELGVPLVTRDRRILDYGDDGWLRVFPC